jgi:hypothetical protein
MKSSTLPLYKSWLESASALDAERVDAVYLECEKHYDVGGDVVVECMSPDEVLSHFILEARDWGQVLEKVRTFCNVHIEQSRNTRWGEDSDPELSRDYWTIYGDSKREQEEGRRLEAEQQQPTIERQTDNE